MVGNQIKKKQKLHNFLLFNISQTEHGAEYLPLPAGPPTIIPTNWITFAKSVRPSAVFSAMAGRIGLKFSPHVRYVTA